MTLLVGVLCASLALLFWTYVGYPAALILWSRLRPRSPRSQEWTPKVTVCIAVHNGMAHLDAKLDGLLSHDYPADLLDIVVVSDGSNDGTAARLSQCASARVHAVIELQRSGKTACLAKAIAAATGEVLVFNDIRQPIAPGSIRALCNALATRELAVAGGTLALQAQAGYGQSVDAYWRYETAVRSAEALTGSVVGVSGALYAVRREDMVVPPPGLILDDLWIPLRIAAIGGRIGLVPSAVAFDHASMHRGAEAARKRRTLAGNWQLMFAWPQLVIPSLHPLAWRFISHKLLRLLAPVFLLAAFVSNALLVEYATVFTALFAAQCAAYIFALFGMALPALRRFLPIRLASAFLEMNIYAVLGFYDFVRQREAHLWSTAAAPTSSVSETLRP